MERVFSAKPPYEYSEVKNALMSPTFVHFTPSIVGRPWYKYSKHPLKKTYEEYALTTGFTDNSNLKWKIKFRNIIMLVLYLYFPMIFLRLLLKFGSRAHRIIDHIR